MQMIRNFFQVARYLATSTVDERIERQLSKMRFGLSDYERDERARKIALYDRIALVCVCIAALIGLYTMADAYFDLSVHIAEWVNK